MGDQWQLTRAKRDEYATTYPQLDLDDELTKACQWCIDNPGKRKTNRGMPKFLNGWLGRVTQCGADPPGGNNNSGSGMVQCGPVDENDPRLQGIYARAS